MYCINGYFCLEAELLGFSFLLTRFRIRAPLAQPTFSEVTSTTLIMMQRLTEFTYPPMQGNYQLQITANNYPESTNLTVFGALKLRSSSHNM